MPGVTIDRVDFANRASFRLRIQFAAAGTSFESFFSDVVFARLADEIFGCFISYFRALWHFDVPISLTRSDVFTTRTCARRETILMFSPAICPSRSDITFFVAIQPLGGYKQIPSSFSHTNVHKDNRALRCHESELTLY